MNRRQLLKRAGLVGGAGLTGLTLVGNQFGNGEGDPITGEDTTTPSETAERTTRRPGETTARTTGQTTTTESSYGHRPTASPTVESVRYAEEYDTVVNALSAGADPTGRQPVNHVFEEHAGDETLLSFPAGTYRIDLLELEGLSNFGIASAFERRPTFVPVRGRCPNEGQPYLRFDEVEELRLDNVNVDFRERGAGGELRITARGDVTVGDVHAVGNCGAQTAMFRVDLLEESATGLVENLHLRNHRRNRSLTGVFVSEAHAGDLTFRDCEVRGFSGNGLYASPPGLPGGGNGPVHVEGGLYKNNNIANVRLGSTGATATDVSVVVDSVPPEHVGVNARGIRLTDRRDQVVEDCDIYFGAAAGDSFGAVVFHPDNGPAVVRDTKITVDRDAVPAVRTFPNSAETDGAPRFENLTIGGDAGEGHAVLIEGRDGAVVEGCTIEQTGRPRDGIYFRKSEGCRLVDSHIDVTDNPLVLRNSTVDIENTTLVTLGGERHIESMHAEDEDFTPRGDK